MLEVLRSGFLTLLVDYARSGYQHLGLTESGPMDESAYLWANKLLGNHFNVPMLEITSGGLVARFSRSTGFVVTGADMRVKLNGTMIGRWQYHTAHAGDEIVFGNAVNGMRGYLSVVDGFDVEMSFGSVNTVVREQIGGLAGNGCAIQVGDEIPYREVTKKPLPFLGINIPKYSPVEELQVIPGYQFDHFKQASQRILFEQEYEVLPQSDRMGCRLSGEPLSLDGVTTERNLLSEGTALGAIQVLPDGQPVILMRDRQTIGGYPKIGCVVREDISRLAQCKPGTWVYFRLADREKMEKQYLEYLEFFNVTQ